METEGSLWKIALGERWVTVLLAAVGTIVLSVLCVAGLFMWLFIPWAPEADFPAAIDAIEAYEQDLTHLVRYADYEKAFDDPLKRATFLDRIDEIRTNLAGMTPAQFELAVARAVAAADNGHTNVSPIGRTRRVNHFPVRTGPFQDGEFVLQAEREHRDLLGAEILAVGDHPIAEVVDAFLPYVGGAVSRARFFTHLFIMSPALLHARGFTESPDGALLTFRLPDGEKIDRYMDGLAPQDGGRQPFGREVMDYRVPSVESDDWLHLMAGQRPPHYLAEPDEPYLYRFLESHHGGYIKINFNADTESLSLTDWLENTLSDLSIHKPAFVVVDLRFNGGGTDATADFARRLPSIVANDGPIYVLISAETFSAAIGAAAQLKKFAGDRSRIVGSPAGDRLRFVANGGSPYLLPNSKITLNIWSAWEDYAEGCWDWLECFWLSPFFRESGVGNLDPDIPVPLRFRDYAGNHDAALAAALADTRQAPRLSEEKR